MYAFKPIQAQYNLFHTCSFSGLLHLIPERKKKRAGNGNAVKAEAKASLASLFFKTYSMYLEIDFTPTFHKLREHFLIANETLKVQSPELFRKLSLKSTHMETMKEIIRFYAAYLHKNKIMAATERRFWITNTAIAKYKIQHPTTIYRHIEVLLQTGIIKNKVFHGSNCGIELELNTEVLVFKKEHDSGKDWIDQELVKYTDEVEKTKKENVDSISLQTQNATCNDNDPCYKKNINVNVGCGKVENFEKRENEKMSKTRQRSRVDLRLKEKQDTMPVGAAGGKPEFAAHIDFYTGQAWQFARSTLYPGQNFSQNQEILSLFYIRKYFALISAESFTPRHVDNLLSDFYERILLARKYLDKSPERFIPVPWLYFDKDFEGGFKGTLGWFKKVKAKRRELKDYYTHLRDFARVYKAYAANPNLYTYRLAEAEIRKKNDPKLLEIYYTCVGSPKKYSPGFLQSYYKQVQR